MKEKIDENIKEKVDLLTTINFNISNCPKKTFDDFVRFAQEHCNHPFSGKPIYHVAIRMLLDLVKSNATQEMMYRRLVELEDRLDALTELSSSDEKKKKKRKETFGGVDENE